jgi:hypothetical protein
MTAKSPHEGWPLVPEIDRGPCDWLVIQRGLATSPGAVQKSRQLAAGLQGWPTAPRAGHSQRLTTDPKAGH